MKKLNQKGFSLVELLATVAIVAILTGITILTYSRYIENTRKKTYQYMVDNAKIAMDNYILDHPDAKEMSFEDLIDGNYLKAPQDPRNAESTCRGKVFLQKSSTVDPDADENALTLNEYRVSVCCEDYNYTYEPNQTNPRPDSYCKADPYDITQIKDIRVLNVYPNSKYANRVQQWMQTYGKNPDGNQIITVDAVSMDDFNNNPYGYLKENGEWKYNVLVFGFADSNQGSDGIERDLKNDSVVEAVRVYLNNGGSAIFGHDTIVARHTYFNKLRGFVNMDTDGDLGWDPRTDLTIQKHGIFTQYPHNIEKEHPDGKLKIETSHVYGQIAHGDVWITFDNIGEPAKSVYLSTYGNNAYIQTGHTNGSATEDEQKIIANIIFYMVAKQYVDDDED